MEINKSKNKKLVFLLASIVALFLIQALYLVFFQLTKADELNNHKLNARNQVDETLIARGTIFDRNGKELAYSKLVDGAYQRENLYNYLYSTIIGYNSIQYGKSGLELTYNADLLNLKHNADIFTRLDNLFDNSEKGNDLYLTIDDKLQSYTYDLLGDKKGAVIVANPKTGAILSMVSKPSLSIKGLEDNWDEIVNSEDGLMLNRATQGLYEPGSIFKAFTSIAFLRSGMDLNYNDTGEATIADYTVHNFDNQKYGEMDLEKALQVSSNTYFFEKSQDVTNEMFSDTLKDFGIGVDDSFPINRNKSIFPYKKGLSNLEKGNTAFGQGEMYVTPIDMLQIAMGIANDGVVYKPYIVNKINRSNGEEVTNPKILSDKIEKKYAETVRKYLLSTAKYNGYTLNSGQTMAGKTGTAETTNNLNNAWYLGMSPADDPKYVVIVVVERTEQLAGRVAAPIAIKTLDYIYQNNIDSN
ncbi:peptidoglycan D,D-transpeptidase FtsI family protein [Helcococcus kunzii]|uniref:Uncharacterized protein n=1 Tax=Helcococcus kunzii ATCC 51366 TaxID=883114 RepID=H3NN13_9FIRM|nr:penicillin-binding transpeptidase domain-containing protein [Helcococcus kunzii]EHR34417.1 hypothetical protein HMPREF9709_00724 [Helcococcus kunzii ATCC 51366]MCT1795415.1 penicillin-binding transpeptidase domain-containing protein [Helcococcus kunzii]MCT1989798.1 penicillin-binding transpeptidase domain-containing protein [Helcococcus kunzii]QZO77074.1 hypothetical protein HIF96_03380 [Helcococcus kunzii]